RELQAGPPGGERRRLFRSLGDDAGRSDGGALYSGGRRRTRRRGRSGSESAGPLRVCLCPPRGGAGRRGERGIWDARWISPRPEPKMPRIGDRSIRQGDGQPPEGPWRGAGGPISGGGGSGAVGPEAGREGPAEDHRQGGG